MFAQRSGSLIPQSSQSFLEIQTRFNTFTPNYGLKVRPFRTSTYQYFHRVPLSMFLIAIYFKFSLRSMAVLSRATEWRSRKNARTSGEAAPATISSRFLCPRPPLLLSRPTKTTMLRSGLFYIILSSDRRCGAVSWSLTSLCDSCSCAALS